MAKPQKFGGSWPRAGNFAFQMGREIPHTKSRGFREMSRSEFTTAESTWHPPPAPTLGVRGCLIHHLAQTRT